jgi:hypothetical protein
VRLVGSSAGTSPAGGRFTPRQIYYSLKQRHLSDLTHASPFPWCILVPGPDARLVNITGASGVISSFGVVLTIFGFCIDLMRMDTGHPCEGAPAARCLTTEYTCILVRQAPNPNAESLFSLFLLGGETDRRRPNRNFSKKIFSKRTEPNIGLLRSYLC